MSKLREPLTNPACQTTNKAFSQLMMTFNERNPVSKNCATAHRGAGKHGCLQTNQEFGMRQRKEDLTLLHFKLLNN